MPKEHLVRMEDDTLQVKNEPKKTDARVSMPGTGDGEIAIGGQAEVQTPPDDIEINELSPAEVKIDADGMVEYTPPGQEEEDPDHAPPDHDDEDEDDEEEAPPPGEVDPAVREARRLRNRNARDERKRRRKEWQRRNDERFDKLERENSELRERVGAAISTSKIDTDEQELQRLRDRTATDFAQAEKDFEEHFAAGDSKKTLDAMKRMKIADDVLIGCDNALGNIKKIKADPKLLKNFQSDGGKDTEAEKEDGAPNPVVERLKRKFLADNPWYGQPGNRRDTYLAQSIGDDMAEEDYTFDTPEDWEEMQRRVDEALPHRIDNKSKNGSGGRVTNQNNPPPQRQNPPPQQRQAAPRRAPVAPRNQRESGGPGGGNRVPAESLLTPIQKTALEQANVQKGSKEWAQIVAHYISENRKAAAARDAG